MDPQKPESFDESLEFVENREGKSYFIPGCIVGVVMGVLLAAGALALLFGFAEGTSGSEVYVVLPLLLGAAVAVYHVRNKPRKFMQGFTVGTLVVVGVAALAFGLCIAILSQQNFN